MNARLFLVPAIGLAAACTIFNGLTPAASDGGTVDASLDHALPPPACDDAGACVPGVGLCKPQSTCMDASPCTNGLVVSSDGAVHEQPISNAFDPPTCTPPGSAVHDGPLSWADPTGATRTACVFRPGGTSRPLVVFIHPLGGSADDIYQATGLRELAPLFNLQDGQGFILASDQGQNLVSPNSYPSGPAHDLYYRDFTSDSGFINPDFRAIDYLLDTLVSQGGVDTSRIYLMGWGQGAFFAEEYALVRHTTATPGGNKVAAASVYEGADPFQSPTSASSEKGCTLSTYPKSDLAIEIVHRACSTVACDSDQQTTFGSPPGYDVETWVGTLKTTEGATVQDEIIDFFEKDAACAENCKSSIATDPTNTAWPTLWTKQMLTFLGAHKL